MTESKPLGASEYRVYRGGGWYNYYASVARAANRDGYDPSHRSSELGFRCARVGSRRKVGEKL